MNDPLFGKPDPARGTGRGACWAKGLLGGLLELTWRACPLAFIHGSSSQVWPGKSANGRGLGGHSSRPVVPLRSMRVGRVYGSRPQCAVAAREVGAHLSRSVRPHQRWFAGGLGNNDEGHPFRCPSQHGSSTELYSARTRAVAVGPTRPVRSRYCGSLPPRHPSRRRSPHRLRSSPSPRRPSAR